MRLPAPALPNTHGARPYSNLSLSPFSCTPIFPNPTNTNTNTNKTKTLHLTKYRHLTVELSSAAVRALTAFDVIQAREFNMIPYKAHKPEQQQQQH